MTVTKLRPATWPGEQFGCGWGCLLPERVALERARKGDNSLHDRCIGLLPYGNIAIWQYHCTMVKSTRVPLRMVVWPYQSERTRWYVHVL